MDLEETIRCNNCAAIMEFAIVEGSGLSGYVCPECGTFMEDKDEDKNLRVLRD